MKRILVVAALAALLLSSCAATWYTVRPITVTAPLNDNNASSCLLPPDPWPVSPGTLRMLHVRWAQSGSVVREDSISCGAGATAPFAGISVPGPSTVTVTSWASDVGGPGCTAVLSITPTSTTKPPAAPVIQ